MFSRSVTKKFILADIWIIVNTFYRVNKKSSVHCMAINTIIHTRSDVEFDNFVKTNSRSAMALLNTIDKTILFAAKREVKFFDSTGTNVFKLSLPKFDPKNAKQTEDNDEDDEQSEEIVTKIKPGGSSKDDSVIQNLAVSPNGQLLVITTTGDKLVYLYKILSTDKHELVSTRPLPRISSAIVFSSNSRKFYIADKTGDCYEYDCENLESAGKWILGHLSMLLDVLVTQDNR